MRVAEKTEEGTMRKRRRGGEGGREEGRERLSVCMPEATRKRHIFCASNTTYSHLTTPNTFHGNHYIVSSIDCRRSSTGLSIWTSTVAIDIPLPPIDFRVIPATWYTAVRQLPPNLCPSLFNSTSWEDKKHVGFEVLDLGFFHIAATLK
jgi:hypothetical protein